jgi:hypothetical protein
MSFAPPKSEYMEPMLIILPPPALFMVGYTALEHRNTLRRLVSRISSYSLEVRSCGIFLMFIPALFTSTSIRPKASRVFATMDSI